MQIKHILTKKHAAWSLPALCSLRPLESRQSTVHTPATVIIMMALPCHFQSAMATTPKQLFTMTVIGQCIATAMSIIIDTTSCDQAVMADVDINTAINITVIISEATTTIEQDKGT